MVAPLVKRLYSKTDCLSSMLYVLGFNYILAKEF